MAKRRGGARRGGGAARRSAPVEARDPPASAKPRTSLGQRALLAVFGVGLLLVALCLLELALSLVGAGDAVRFEDPFVGFAAGSDVFVPRTTSAGAVLATDPARLGFFNEQQFAATKPAGGYRIFALGGSTVAGRPYDDHLAFPAWLERWLREADPGRPWEVVNAGAISYASYRLVVLMKELRAYDPDLVVVYTGHNEFLEERTYGELRDRDPRLLALERRLGRFRFWALARGAIEALRGGDRPAPAVLGAEVEAKLEGWAGLDRYHRDDALAGAIVEHFTFNLRQLVALARDADAEIVFVQPIANLADFSPFKPEPGDGASPETRAEVRRKMREGLDWLDGGDAAAAVAALERAVDLDPRDAAAQFALGRARLAAGDEPGARRAFIRAKDEDTAPLRALEPILAAVRRVAVEEGVPWIDLPTVLEAEQRLARGHGILGDGILLDHVHPDTPAHATIADLLLDHLVTRKVARPRPDWNAEQRRTIYDEVLGGLDRRYYAQRDLNLAKVLGWAGKLDEAEGPLLRAAEVLDDEPDLHFSLGVLRQRTNRPSAALPSLERTVALSPNWPAAHFNLGVTRSALGDVAGAQAALETALHLDPDYDEARYNLAVLQSLRGDTDAAVSAFTGLLEEEPSSARAHHGLGIARRRQGHLDDALEALARAVALDSTPSFRVDLGTTLARVGRPEEAAAAFRAALVLDPDYAEAWYNLGVAEASLGRRDAAAEAYLRAVETAGPAEPFGIDARINLGVSKAASGAAAEALGWFDAALEADPRRADAHLNRAVVLENLGRLDDAAAAAGAALVLEPDNPRFQLVLGLVELARGRIEVAKPLLEKAAAAGQTVPPAVREQIGGLGG